MLSKYEISMSKEKIEKVDMLRYAWRNLQTLAKDVQGALVQVQPTFKQNLSENIVEFDVDLKQFLQQYEEVEYLFTDRFLLRL